MQTTYNFTSSQSLIAYCQLFELNTTLTLAGLNSGKEKVEDTYQRVCSSSSERQIFDRRLVAKTRVTMKCRHLWGVQSLLFSVAFVDVP